MDGSTPLLDGIADGTVGELRAAVLILARRMRHQQAEGTLSPSEASVLGRVGRMGPVTPATLARCEHVQPPSMTHILDRLAARGLVRRHRDLDDRRQLLVSRTAAGDELAEEIRALRTEWLACQFDQLNSTDRAAITAAAPALRRLAELA
ncbi:MarR family winged helix-turn-helix transcriptional regulator [Leekyejoonella antrihumi]|uniref:MarR family transcriptional regulator n=1 Tax=Leekyejoonella antrihumi TaxID=1660198 RepID=A0A563DV14_9MICO|nr:MarR family transcriptional regulator [Leekyejoonella antrihumi]TWP33534.1 MarR family transcriptional regulator [Leekyejoonella antrihumi]